MKILLNLYRRGRVLVKQVAGVEPRVKMQRSTELEFHGHMNYGGWAIPKGSIQKESIIVDVGLGEDISFSESIIQQYGCVVHGFDPTPKSIRFIKSKSPVNFILHEEGIGSSTRKATFYLPNENRHVSGSITPADHVGVEEIEVQLIGLCDVFAAIESEKIAILKIDIEGAEYELLGSDDFLKCAQNIDIICVEFHHRWKEFGKESTEAAIERLTKAGFSCVWRKATSNEEFTFARLK